MKRCLVLALFAVSLSFAYLGCSDDDDDSGNGGVSARCDLPSDCATDQYCLFTQEDLDADRLGTCLAVPEGCSVPTSCAECLALHDPCDSANLACSDSTDFDGNVTGNPMVTCQ